METKYRSIVLMGKTGSGKGTQAARLAQALDYEVFSTGARVREIGSKDTPLGRQIQKIQVSAWVPEWLASHLLVKALLEDDTEKGLVFESVARKPEEARKLHEIHVMLERPYIVLNLDVPDEVVIERMRNRHRDASDSESNIQNRLQAFREETMQSLQFFTEQQKVVTINGGQTEEQVFNDIIEAIAV